MLLLCNGQSSKVYDQESHIIKAVFYEGVLGCGVGLGASADESA